MKLRSGFLLALPIFMTLLAPNIYADAFLGTTLASFAVLGAQSVTNSGVTTITGNLGVSPGSSITGATLCPGASDCVNLTGTIQNHTALANVAQDQLTTAYNDLAGRAPNTNLTGRDLGGLTLVPGVYRFDSSAQLTGLLTLDAGGRSDPLFVFQIVSTLTTSPDSTTHSEIRVINGGANRSVYFQVGSAATLGDGTHFDGNILALTKITLDPRAEISCGRALVTKGGDAVTLINNSVSIGCLGAGGPPPSPTPEPSSFLLLGSGLAVLVQRIRSRKS